MLNLKYTRVFQTVNRPVVTGIDIAEEGMALVYEKEVGETKVRPSTGVSGEVFAGISVSRASYPFYVPMVEEFVIEADGVAILSREPVAGQILVKVDDVTKTVVTGTPASAAEVQVVDNTVTFAAAQSGKTCLVQYKYIPTALEARTLSSGDVYYAPITVSNLRVVGVITQGDICTSSFDASVDWSNALTVKLGANGMFTTTGVGVTVPGAVVLNSPSAENSMLTLRFVA